MSEYGSENEVKKQTDDDQTEGSDVDKSTDPGPVPGEPTDK